MASLSSISAVGTSIKDADNAAVIKHLHHTLAETQPDNLDRRTVGSLQSSMKPFPRSPAKVEQAQQWLQREGLESSIVDLVAYVDAVSTAKAKQAAQHEQQLARLQEQHQASLQEQHRLQQFNCRLQQQVQQLQLQQQDLDRLRRLQPTTDNHYTHIYQELDQQSKELASWRCKYHAEQQCRDIAESAVKETIVVVDQLTEECAAVSGMLQDLQQLEAATDATAEHRSGTKKQALKWLSIEVTAALLLVACTAAATFLITRAVMHR